MLGEFAIVAGLSGRTDAHPVTTAAAAVLPMVSKKSRRLGSGGPDCSWSSMQFPFEQELLANHHSKCQSIVRYESGVVASLFTISIC